LFNNY
jgi:hypothetical protein